MRHKKKLTQAQSPVVRVHYQGSNLGYGNSLVYQNPMCCHNTIAPTIRFLISYISI